MPAHSATRHAKEVRLRYKCATTKTGSSTSAGRRLLPGRSHRSQDRPAGPNCQRWSESGPTGHPCAGPFRTMAWGEVRPHPLSQPPVPSRISESGTTAIANAHSRMGSVAMSNRCAVAVLSLTAQQEHALVGGPAPFSIARCNNSWTQTPHMTAVGPGADPGIYRCVLTKRSKSRRWLFRDTFVYLTGLTPPLLPSPYPTRYTSGMSTRPSFIRLNKLSSSRSLRTPDSARLR